MKDQLDEDRAIRIVDAGGPTLTAAVMEAATLLDIPMRRLEYEVAIRGSPGFLGTGKKDWKIRAYQRVVKEKDTLDEIVESAGPESALPVIENRDGDVFVQLTVGGLVLMKVSPPVGKGQRADEAQALYALERRGETDCDRELIARTVEEAGAIYVHVGEFNHQYENDSKASVDVFEGEMKASIILSPPGLGGADLSLDDLQIKLKAAGVIHGVNDEFLTVFCDRPVYNENVVVAEGTQPVDGRDAYIQYYFEPDQSKVRLREGRNGQVNFKELNIVQNVVEKQPLAKKVAAERGSLGKTVTGKSIPTRDGKDISIPLGKNVHLGEDGVTVVSDISGQVVMSAGGLINVEPVLTVEGDVNLKTGNIIFLGTVIITGNVEPGFSVKAAGNIEISGIVEKAELDAEGDIIVHQGITGKSGGTIRAGKSLWARFIENATIEAGNMVVASDGIINSHVDAYKRIVCQGKRAHIVGGRLRASEEINANIFGSPTSGTETICEVGIDPKYKEQLQTLQVTKTDMEKQLDETQLNLQTLVNIKKQRKFLPPDKEAALRELMDKRNLLLTDLQKLEEDIDKIHEILNSTKTRGRISAAAKVYPGVKIIIRDITENVRTEYKAVSFILTDGLIRVSQYEEPDEEARRGPDGYTTD
jgi:uncharacterized protein (DUF342 family)